MTEESTNRASLMAGSHKKCRLRVTGFSGCPHSKENKSGEHTESWAEVHKHTQDELLGRRGNTQTGIGRDGRLARRAVRAVPGV